MSLRFVVACFGAILTFSSGQSSARQVSGLDSFLDRFLGSSLSPSPQRSVAL